MTLPAPLDKWGRIACTPFGHVLTSSEGWVWVAPDASDHVFVPSQLADGPPMPTGNASYFSKIEVTRVDGEEFDDAYGIFHAGFEKEQIKPDGYRVDLTSVSGKTLRMYFFDYDSYAWGMWCPGHDCSTDSHFAVLNKTHRPQLRRDSI